MIMRDPNRTLQIPIKITKGTARAGSRPADLARSGRRHRRHTRDHSHQSGALPDFLKASSDMPFSVTVEAAGTHLELKGNVALPIDQLAMRMKLSVHGERLDSLDQLAHVQLPPWGPWDWAVRFRIA